MKITSRYVIAGLALASLCAAATIIIGGPRVHTAPGGPSYIVDENCEGTGKPSAAWTDINTVDWDDTTVPLDGAQSLEIIGQSGGARAQYDFTPAVDEIWVRFKWRTNSTGSLTRILSFRNQTGDAELGWINTNASSQLQIFNGSGVSVATSDALSVNTEYNIWARFKKGTGANGEATIAFSATDTEPTSGNAYNSLTSGTVTSQVNRLQFRNADTSGTITFYFDRMTADDATIGNF